MKKAKIMLIFTIICFIFIPKVFATNYMSVTKSDVKVGETFDVKVNFEHIASWEVHVASSGPVGECTINKADATEDAQNTAKEFKTTCTATGVGTITLTLTGNVTKSAEEGETEDTTTDFNESIEINVTEEERPQGLASLSVTGGTLSPTFNSDKNTGYIITLNSSETTTFSINAVAKTNTDNITSVRENGEDYVPVDLSNITFVTAGNNSTMLIEISVGEGARLVKYEIQVVKPTKVNPPVLTRLAIDGENITLVDGIYTYEITLDEKDSYLVTATIKDTSNYMFDEFLNPPVEIYGKEFELGIKPKDPSSGLSSAVYHVVIKTNTIEPVTTPKETTTKKSGGNTTENPQTGSTPAYIVAIILVISLAISLYLYKKNINSYN